MKKPLTDHADALWSAVRREFGVTDPEGEALLRVACEALADYEAYRAQVQKDGPTVQGDRGGVKAHPLIAAARDARGQFLAALKQLGLEQAESVAHPPGRPTLMAKVGGLR